MRQAGAADTTVEDPAAAKEAGSIPPEPADRDTSSEETERSFLERPTNPEINPIPMLPMPERSSAKEGEPTITTETTEGSSSFGGISFSLKKTPLPGEFFHIA